MSPEFEQLYHRHVIMSYEKQLRLADMVGTHSWSFSMSDGSLTFQGEGEPARAPIVFAAQLLGTAAEGDSTWLWSWANDASRIPAALTQDARHLREVGTAREWATPNFAIDLGNADEHRLAMTSAGVLGADAYYRGPYAGGAAFFLLRDERLRLDAPEGPRVVRTVMEAISNISIANHRAAVLAYLTGRGLQPQADGENAIVAMIAGRALRAAFDKQDRLADIKGSFGP